MGTYEHPATYNGHPQYLRGGYTSALLAKLFTHKVCAWLLPFTQIKLGGGVEGRVRGQDVMRWDALKMDVPASMQSTCTPHLKARRRGFVRCIR